eukprot:1599521-Amphidinium_carterae.1
MFTPEFFLSFQSFLFPESGFGSCPKVRDTQTMQSELHGFVNFRTYHDAERALKLLSNQRLGGIVLQTTLIPP